jgi:hypothetical protein
VEIAWEWIGGLQAVGGQLCRAVGPSAVALRQPDELLAGGTPGAHSTRVGRDFWRS